MPEPILISRLMTSPVETGQKLALLVDLARQEIRVNAESAALHLVPVLTAAVPSLAGVLKPLATEQASHLRLSGVIPWQRGKATQLAGWVAMDGPVKLNPAEDSLIEVTQFQTGFSIHNQTLMLGNLAGSLWSGHLQLAEARVNLKDRTWQVQGAELKEIRIPELKRGLGLPDRQQQGALHGTWQGGGGLKLTSLAGHGSLRITDEGFHRLPMLGPMSVIFLGLAPGFAEETTSRMATDYALSGGILTLSRLKVDSEFTEVQADGDLNLVTQHAKLTARAKLRGIAELPTGLLGRLLTLDGEGPFSDIQWRLRYAFGLEQVTGVAGATESAVKGLGKTAKEILGIPGRLLPHGKKKGDQ